MGHLLGGSQGGGQRAAAVDMGGALLHACDLPWTDAVARCRVAFYGVQAQLQLAAPWHSCLIAASVSQPDPRHHAAP